jgi:hypothetical protein
MNLRALIGPASGYVVSVVTVAGAVLLAALGHAVPDQLWTLAATGLGVGAGASLPSQHTAEPAAAVTPGA